MAIIAFIVIVILFLASYAYNTLNNNSQTL